MKAQMSEKTSSCLTQQHRPYFILCAVNQPEASEQTGTEGAGKGGGGGRDRKEETIKGERKVVGWWGDSEQ